MALPKHLSGVMTSNTQGAPSPYVTIDREGKMQIGQLVLTDLGLDLEEDYLVSIDYDDNKLYVSFDKVIKIDGKA